MTTSPFHLHRILSGPLSSSNQSSTMPEAQEVAHQSEKCTTPPDTPSDSASPDLSGTWNAFDAMFKPQNVCMSTTCPLYLSHCVGVYKHNGESRTREGEEFGESNPPPKIWASYMRIKSNMDSYRDRLVVDRFIENHASPATEKE